MELFFFLCARHGRQLGGESPLWAWQWEIPKNRLSPTGIFFKQCYIELIPARAF
jgi:hypothetical protein